MHKYLISKYINNLTINDINNFAFKNKIKLTNDESYILFNTLKQKWEVILYKDPEPVFKELKSKLSTDSYQKGIALFQQYYEMYKNYL